MRPFIALTFVLGCAYGAPSLVAAPGYAGYAGLAAAPGYAGYAGLAAAPSYAGYAGLAAAPLAVAHAAPVAVAAAPAVSVPAPYSTHTQAEGVTSVHQPASVVTKQIHYGQTPYVSGYTTAIHKPATPHLPIQVPTVLKGTQSVTAPIVKTQTQIHTVNEPVYVERRVEVPYDAPYYTEQIVKVPTAVHVDAPYNVPYPVAVQGEPIIKKTVAAPIITHSHHNNVAAYAAAPAHLGYAAAPIAAAVH